MKLNGYLTAALLCLAALQAPAQDVVYALPSTTLLLKVDVRQEQFFAGPYAKFAKRMLNIDVRDADAVNTVLTGVEIVPVVEADARAWYSCDPDNAVLLSLSAQGLVSLGSHTAPVRWRFPALSRADYTHGAVTGADKITTRIEFRQSISEEGDTLRIPVEHRISESKTLEDKAAEAADMILSIRKDRLDIASGNTDASFSGDALAAALRELDRREQEYLALFRGYSRFEDYSAVFEVTPDPTQRNQRYVAFRLTEQGPVADGVRGVPYYIELEAEPGTAPSGDSAERKKGKALYYRIPAVCKLSLTQDGKPLLQSRVPVYQLGREAAYPLVK